MAPRTNSPRLSAIMPTVLARACVAALLRHVESHVGRLAQADAPPAGTGKVLASAHGDAWETTVGTAVVRLHGFACGTLVLTEAESREAIELLGSAMFGCAAEPQLNFRTVASMATPESEIGVLLLAAHTRREIDAGSSVTPRELAALVGLSATHVRFLCRERDMIRARLVGGDEWRIGADAARAVLVARATGDESVMP